MNSPRHSNRQRLARHASIFVLTASILLSATHAQSAVPTLLPAKPLYRQPVGLVAAVEGATVLTFTWDQPAPGALANSLNPPSDFVVCLQDAASVAPCTYPGAKPGLGVWTRSASAMPAGVPIYGPLPPNLLWYNKYTFTIPAALSSSFFNKELRVVVGACTAQTTAACAFSNPRSLRLSSIDLYAENTSYDINSATQLRFYGQAKNQGSSVSGAFKSSLSVFQVELTQAGVGFPWQCQTNPNASGLNLANNDLLINWNGELIEVMQRRNAATGVIDVSGLDIKGIHRTSHSEFHAIGGPIAVDSMTIRETVDKTVNMTRPSGFVSALTVDMGGTEFEYDESNNRRADCEVIQ